ncbi:excalibur calcium-binding domain-containing protein [Microbacterium sp. Yaish 1]|uniref:excalibur calcium-binding domain-containing protein n=1 Tax=Microbacterium sp. Yaish 1 TaxID=2025014 RepID=UPI002795AD10|nr:excalibur calcium-binding domain-containing protein [Microbacterium sp. Yaish 1]
MPPVRIATPGRAGARRWRRSPVRGGIAEGSGCRERHRADRRPRGSRRGARRSRNGDRGARDRHGPGDRDADRGDGVADRARRPRCADLRPRGSAVRPDGAGARCSGTRNAGAAPVRAGDPGYGRHLDRDGDGIGCE